VRRTTPKNQVRVHEWPLKRARPSRALR
jgi:hypothetical protein